MTAFLERFFERYVSFDYTAELEEELDDVSGGRLDWQKLLEDFWRDFKPKAGEVMEQKPSDVTAALDDFLAPWLFPDKGDGSDPRLCPLCGDGRLGLRGGKFGAFVACSNYPECKYTRRFGQGEEAASEGPAELGNGIMLKSGRFGPYLERDGSARVAAQGRAAGRADAGDGGEAAVAAARDRAASGDRQADHRLDRPLRALSGARRQICAADFDRRGVRDRHERGGGQAGRGRSGQGRARRQRASRSRCLARIRNRARRSR